MKRKQSTIQAFCHAQQQGGFTLVEMLLVIGVIGILAAALAGSFSHVKSVARQSLAHTQVTEVATALTLYLQQNREWPLAFENKTELDEDVCLVLQKAKLLDLTTYKMDSSGNLEYENDADKPKKNESSLDYYGMLDPWGRAVLRRNPTASAQQAVPDGKTLIDHRIQFRVDKNYDGYVDGKDDAPDGISVRASVIVWSRGPDGLDDYTKESLKAAKGWNPPYDDRLSFKVGK